MRSRCVVALLTLTLGASAVLTGCGEEATTTVAAPVETAARHDHPTGTDDVVLSIDDVGGFVPVESLFVDQPELVVAGDGRVLVPTGRSVTSSYEELAEVQLDETDVQALLGLADDAGLLGPVPDYEPTGNAMMSDGSTTTVTIATDGRTYEHGAYLLGANGGAGDEDAGGPRDRLHDFTQAASSLVLESDETDVTDLPAHIPDAVRLQSGPAPDDPSATDWSVAGVRLADARDCLVVSGDDVAAVIDAISARDGATYRQGGETYSLVAAAVIPGDGDDPCASWSG